MKNIAEKIEKLQNSGVQVVTGGGSNAISISIVNSQGNGKRIAFSKKLTEELTLTDKIYMIPNTDDGELILSSVPIHDISSSGNLNGTTKKICYSAALVDLLVNAFNLNYKGKTSLSFNEISFEEYDDAKVAIVRMIAKQ